MTSVGFLLHTDELDAQDFVRKEWDACKSRRTYDSEESILVEVMNGEERECKSVYLESMTVKYINYYEKTVAKGIAKTVVSWLTFQTRPRRFARKSTTSLSPRLSPTDLPRFTRMITSSSPDGKEGLRHPWISSFHCCP